MAPSRVVHANCGIFSFISGPVDQVVCNAVTGETVTVQRSAQMIAAQKIYDVKYNEEGWAYLLGHESGKKWFKSLGFILQAKTDDKGKIFIQDSVAKRVYHCDDATELGRGVEKHLNMTQEEKLTFITYPRDRHITVIEGGGYHQPSGALFWEIRTLKNLIDLKHLSGNESINRWVKSNYHRAQEFWDEIRRKAGFDGQAVHWMPSELSKRMKSEKDAQAAAKSAKESGMVDAEIPPAPIGVSGLDYNENFVCSTQAALFTFLHWHKSLGTPVAKASSLDALDRLLEKSLGGVKRVWITNSDVPCGSITTRGAHVTVEGSTIKNASELCKEFPLLKAALGRKTDRGVLLDLEDQDGHSGMHSFLDFYFQIIGV